MSEKLLQQIAKELEIPIAKVAATVKLLDDGNTVPFITRYRKEVTGGLDEEKIRAIEERIQYLRNLETRKQEILEKIQALGKCTPELQSQIENAYTLKTLEDLYLPYRPKRRTRAIIAKEKGLEPLAQKILENAMESPDSLALPYISEEKELPDIESVWQGAMDIVAEALSEDIKVREKVRKEMMSQGILVSQRSSKESEDEEIYKDYFEYEESLSQIPPHRILALDRGEEEGILKIKIQLACEKLCQDIVQPYLINPSSPLISFLKEALDDGYDRLIFPAISREIRHELTEKAHLHAVDIFAKNLRNLLMQPPMKDMCILAIDPGYVSGCKLAVLSSSGDLLAYDVMFPHQPQKKTDQARAIILKYYRQYGFKSVVIGNGTACRETEELISDLIQEEKLDLVYTIVSEAGASVYSASEAAREEFPELDASYRGTISIGRRLLDPLAELVKIDPKSLGIGLYQHDINPKMLDKALYDVVESVVNYVGVDINRASVELLSYIAGINKRSAKNIVKFRKEKGSFKNREEFKKVSGIGEETFTQCAGFLRIANGENPLDNTSIHPESYKVCEDLLKILNEDPSKIFERNSFIQFKLKQQFNEQDILKKLQVGKPTFQDILDNLKKPGRDPRESVPPPIFRKGILTLDDLAPGMELQGTVRNVVDFGAFVDIGVKVDGLVHVSQMSKQYVTSSLSVCKVGDNVKVKILNIDKGRKRISLTMVLS